MSKMRMNYWKCTCGYRGERAGGSSIGYDENGEVKSDHSDYGCPVCGNRDMEWVSEIVETWITNQTGGSSETVE